MADLKSDDEVLTRPEATSNGPVVQRQSVVKLRLPDLAREATRSNAGLTGVQFDLGGAQSSQEWGKKLAVRGRGDGVAYDGYRQLCLDLEAEVARADGYLVGGKMSDEGLEVVVEVGSILDRLYQCKWGNNEYLQRVVVAIYSQVNNVEWTAAHVAFLRGIARILRITYVVNERVIDECYDLIEQNGLEPFRGSVTETGGQKRYRIVEVEET